MEITFISENSFFLIKEQNKENPKLKRKNTCNLLKLINVFLQYLEKNLFFEL